MTLAERVALARARLEPPRTPDTGLQASVDDARERLGHTPRYVDETRLEQLRNAPVGEHLEGIARGGWEHRHACPDCTSFRGPNQYPCPQCRSFAKPIPAHERSKASAATRKNGARRRADKRRRVKRGR